MSRCHVFRNWAIVIIYHDRSNENSRALEGFHAKVRKRRCRGWGREVQAFSLFELQDSILPLYLPVPSPFGGFRLSSTLYTLSSLATYLVNLFSFTAYLFVVIHYRTTFIVVL